MVNNLRRNVCQTPRVNKTQTENHLSMEFRRTDEPTQDGLENTKKKLVNQEPEASDLQVFTIVSS